MRKLISFVILILVVVLPVAAQDAFVIPVPGTDPSVFPDELPEAVVYEQPQVITCPKDGTIAAPITNAEQTVSTCEQQVLVGNFTLPANAVRFSTAALPVFLTKGEGWNLDTLECIPPESQKTLLANYADWKLVYPDLCSVTKIRPYVVALFNTGTEPVELAVANGFGSFVGDAGLSVFDAWTPDSMVAIRDLHIKKMVKQNQDAELQWANGNPYPEVNWANCTKVDTTVQTPTVTYCEGVNVVVGVWNGQTWQFSFGAYGTGDGGNTYEYIDVKAQLDKHLADVAAAG